MTVDGTNIWTHGLLISKVSGLFDLPARKKTTEIYGTDAKDIQHTDKTVTIEMMGKYTTTANLKTNIEGFKSDVSGGEKTFALPNYSRTFKGIVIGGLGIEILGLIVKLKLRITVTEIVS